MKRPSHGKPREGQKRVKLKRRLIQRRPDEPELCLMLRRRLLVARRRVETALRLTILGFEDLQNSVRHHIQDGVLGAGGGSFWRFINRQSNPTRR
jgi:hypothetical protein